MGYITPQTVIVGRLLTLPFILILRLSQVCTSKDISEYCSLEHWRHSASKRYSYSDIVDSFVKYVSNLQHLAAKRQTRSVSLGVSSNRCKSPYSHMSRSEESAEEDNDHSKEGSGQELCHFDFITLQRIKTGTTPLPSKKRKIKYSDRSPDHHQAVLSKATADTIYNCTGFCVFVPGNCNRCVSCKKPKARLRCVGCNSWFCSLSTYVSSPKNEPPLSIDERAYRIVIDDKEVYGVRSCYSRWHEKSYMKHLNDMNSTLKSLDIDGKESVPIIRSRGESFSTAIKTTVSSSRSSNNRKSLDSGLQGEIYFHLMKKLVKMNN